MEPIKTELVNDERKRDVRGRKIASAQRRRQVLAAYDASGLTQRAFARREGVNFNTLVAWLQKRRAEGAGQPAIRFEEVSLSPESTRATGVLEVTLPGGLLVRGASVAAVAELVRALRG